MQPTPPDHKPQPLSGPTADPANISSQQTTTPVPVEAAPPQSSLKKPNWYKSLKFILILILVLAAAIIVTTWVYTRPSKAPVSSQNSSQPNTKTTVAGPSTVAYSQQTQGELAANNCVPATTELYWRPASGGERTNAIDVGKNNYVSQYNTYKNKVFVVTAPGCESKDGVAIWLSTDSGKTYQKIYSGKPGTGEDGVLADQVTSATFSTDGTAIVFGFLPANSDTNTVKSVSTDSKEAQDLLTITSRGVFITSYDSTKQQLIYSKGKYNSDGGVRDTLYIWDKEQKTENTLVKESSGMSIDQIAPNSDSSKLLFVKSTPGEGMGGGKPYIVEELDVASKTSKKLQTIDEDTYIKIGYRIGDDMPYYSRDNTVYGVESTGNSVALLQTSKPILEVHYADKDHAIVSTGADFGDFEVVNYELSTKSVTSILKGDTFTRVFGASWN